MSEKISAQIPFQDSVEFDPESGGRLHAKGCQVFLEAIKEMANLHGKNPTQWPLPNGTTHEQLLLREFVLRAQGQWQALSVGEEVCHCRAVSAQIIDHAVVMGAHTLEKIRRWTSANTACGTCLNDCEKIIERRLGASR